METYENTASRIIQNCSSIIMNQKSYFASVQKSNNQNMNNDQYTGRNITKDELIRQQNKIIMNKQSFGSPLKQVQNVKIIQKLKRKMVKRKKQKQIFIRKTQLGQNQNIFTKQQLQRLRQIDQEQLFGIKNCYQTSMDIKKYQGKQNNQGGNQRQKKYFSGPILDNQKQQIQNYLSWVDIKQESMDNHKNKNKILHFQKRQKSLPNLFVYNQPNKAPLPTLLSKFSSPYLPIKQLQLQKTISCVPLIKNNSPDKKFLDSLTNNTKSFKNKNISQTQKLDMIIEKSIEKVSKQYGGIGSSKKYIYMTQQRKQAILQCQVLRKIKTTIGPKFYNKLQLKYGKQNQTHPNQEKESSQNKQNLPIDNKPYLKFRNNRNKLLEQSQVQKMIQKNLGRLMEQRKRVIQKIVC